MEKLVRENEVGKIMRKQNNHLHSETLTVPRIYQQR